ncbi:DUF262 domain-containing protein [Paenibacillus durus]|uniref:DUF262 domain-containing protein n=1 Tax=Paenibacillus durus TaxID=44251 RepID=UPI0006938208|nr:DUF262 domain-containing protein [Paenibacillus durus]
MQVKNDPKPDILRIEELVLKVKTGDIKLPKFQRPFVWKKDDILALLDSIYNSYPIGSILLWLTKEKLASERKIGDLDINERPEEYPTNYLLDGQQRLSTLCGALYWNGDNPKSMWNISFDLEREEFIYPNGEEKPHYFPLNKLLGTFDFIGQCKKFEYHQNKDKYEANAGRLLQTIKDYKIAAVSIGDMSIDEVAPIFERINSTGRRLTMVDLMRAATWSGEFDLNDTINSVRDSLSNKRFEDVSETEILRNISSCSGVGINREDIDKLRKKVPTDLIEASEKCKKAYELAVDFITTELPVCSYNYLPYSLQIAFLVDFFNVCPKPNIHQRDELKKWFWRTAIGKSFASFNSAQLSLDLSDFRDFANGLLIEPRFEKSIHFEGFAFDDFRLNKASSKTLGLLLANKKPKSLLDGTPVNIESALSVVNRHEYHHIFPKAFLRVMGTKSSLINSHSNICLLNLGNNREISDTKPSLYFSELTERLGDKLESVLQTHLIDEEAYNAALRNDYETFIRSRSAKIIEQAKLNCGI